MRLTAKGLHALRLPRGVADKAFFDDDLPGFGIRLRATGARTWLVQYAIAGKTRRLTLGSTDVLDPGKAREAAKDALAKVRLGGDPANDKQIVRAAAANTLGSLLPIFLARQKAKLKPRSYVETERHLVGYASALHARPVSAIDRREIAALLAALGQERGPAAANRTRASLSALFTWTAKEGFCEANPVSFTNKAVEKGDRERVVADSELAAIWYALGDDHYSIILRLLLLTGCRREEIGALRWSEIDPEAALITLPGERTKSSKPHLVPLPPIALDIIRAQPQRSDAAGRPRDLIFGHGDGGFQGWSRAKDELDKRLAAAGTPVTDWTLHDFRRTLSTTLHERFGIGPHVVESALGHIAGHKAGVAGTYNKAVYLAERRRALERWADFVLALVGEESATKVVPLR
jgi:integrase